MKHPHFSCISCSFLFMALVVWGAPVRAGWVLSYTNTGLVKIEASQAGDDIYAPAAVTNEVKVWELSVDSGPLAGGNVVTVHCGAMGDGDITEVTVGGLVAVIGAQGADWVEITMPEQAEAGVQDIVITSTGEGETTLSDAYTYHPAGVITDVTPDEGSAGGGFEVTITGTNLGDGDDVTSVTLAGVGATISSQSATEIVVVAGAGAAGVGDVVVVSTSFGTTTDTDAFAYLAQPEMLVLGTNGVAVVASGEVASREKGTRFPNMLEGSAAVIHTFSIRNNGTVELTLEDPALSDDTHFTVAGVPGTVAAGGEESFTVTYDPTAVGGHSAVLYLTNDATTVYTVNLAGGLAEVIPNNGRLSGGNSVTVTNGVLGSGGDIFKVTVGGKEASITAQGTSWVTFTVAPHDEAGVEDVVIESLSQGVTTLPGAYTVNEPGEIKGEPGERFVDYRVNFKPDAGGNPLYEDMISGDGTTNTWTWYNLGRVGDTERLKSTDSLSSNVFLTAYGYNNSHGSSGINYNPTDWISQPAATNFIYHYVPSGNITNRVVVTNLTGSSYQVDFFGGYWGGGTNMNLTPNCSRVSGKKAIASLAGVLGKIPTGQPAPAVKICVRRLRPVSRAGM